MDGAGAAHLCREVSGWPSEPIAGIDRSRCAIAYGQARNPVRTGQTPKKTR
jgi:hypothetical protein